jgi:hypothetical protein
MAFPSAFLHLSAQMLMVDSGTSDYLDGIARIVRTRRELLDRQMGRWFRQQPDRKKADAEFSEFIRQRTDTLIAAAAQQIAKLPRRDGDIDTDALGATPAELARQFSEAYGGSVEDTIEAFLAGRI